MGMAVRVLEIRLKSLELLSRARDWSHRRKIQRTEVGVHGVEWPAILILADISRKQLGGNFLQKAAPESADRSISAGELYKPCHPKRPRDRVPGKRLLVGQFMPTVCSLTFFRVIMSLIRGGLVLPKT